MSYPTVAGLAVEGLLYREAQSCLGTRFANSYYLFFLSGTSTPANVYSNGILTMPFAPTGKVVADSFGRFPAIYLDPSVIYKVQFFNSANVQQWQLDPYVSQLSTVGTSSLSAFGVQIAPTGELTIPPPNTGGSGISLTLNAGSLGSAALSILGTIPGNSALIVNSSATTGAQTATFAATNKPGTATSSPAGWLPITCDGVQYYTPIWHGNPFTPYTSSPTALGEMINAASVTFGGSGVTTAVGGTAVPGNWFSPASTGVGAGFYINITRTGGTVNFSAAQGAWTNIGAGGLTINTSASGTVTGTYQLSNSVTGSPVVANGTINLSTLAILHVYTSGSGTETIPASTNVAMEVWGSGGGGGGGHSASGGGNNLGGTGGGGGFSYSLYATSALGGAGKTFNYIVPAGGAAGVFGGGAGPGDGTNGATGTISAGTVTGFTTMTANGGAFGVHATSAADGANGSGGTASGGNNTNTAGNGTGSGVGIGGQISGDGSPYGAAGFGGLDNAGTPATAGQNGAAVFYYTS